MELNRHALTVIVAAIALQAVAAQDGTGVSMMVTDASGVAAGQMCEPFDCTPHQLPIGTGTTLICEMYGMADQPYILFAGSPSKQCFSLPWVLGAVAMDFPITIVDVGLVPATGLPSSCGVETAVYKIPISDGLPIGAQVVLQIAAWPWQSSLPAFSRAVQVTIV